MIAYASYYYPTSHDPPGVYCAVHGHRGELAIIRTRDGRTIRLRVRDFCPLPSRCDIPERTFRRLFGRKGLKRGIIPVKVRFER